jgi:hypothetical protein
MFKKISLVITLIVITNNLFSQSNWSHVGPISANNSTSLETGLVSNLAIDPNNPLHLFTSSIFGGLWESTDRGQNWTNITTNSTGSNGIKDITFISASKILVGNYKLNYGQKNVSHALSTYNFTNGTWTTLGNLPLPSGIFNYTIKSVAVHPGNSSYLYASTSIGLYRSTDAGVTWTRTLSGCIENVVFISKTSGYYLYAAGSTTPGYYDKPTGVAMLMESADDGVTFTDISSNITMDPSFVHSHSKVCIGPDDGLGNKTVFIMTVAIKLATPAGDPSPPWDLSSSSTNGGEYIHRIVKNINTGVVTSPAIPNNLYYYSYGSPDRMAVAYDAIHNFVWFGGVYLNYLNLGTYIKSGLGGIHNDMHDIDISAYNGNTEMHICSDGGIYKSVLNLANYTTLTTINKGLNICAINGFSGSQQNPNVYSIGSQDITHVDVFNASTGTYSRFSSGESDGTLIDKHDDNFMMYDNQSYDSYTRIVNNYTLSSTTVLNNFYYPKSTLPFEASTTTFLNYSNTGPPIGTFGGDKLKQDPYRRGRLFKLGVVENPKLFQFDFATNKWVYKTIFTDGSGGNCWNEAISDMSFSPQTPNSVYVVTSGGPLSQGDPAARVHKYIGPNFDESFYGHYEFTDAAGNPQWQNISPNYASFSTIGGGAVNIASGDLGKVAYTAIETSPWNKDLIYVTGIFDFTGPNAGIKVIKFNGTTWSDYSTGIPADETVFSMIMDHASNDGIYLTTDKGVYFRDADMANWISYSTGFPIVFSKQIEINYLENTVRAGTYGRGVFKSQLSCPSITNNVLTGPIPPDIYEASNTITASGGTTMTGSPTVFRAANSVVLNPGFSSTGSSTANNYLLAFIHGCSGGSTNPGMFRNSSFDSDSVAEIIENEEIVGVTLYPNPTTGIFTIETEGIKEATMEVYSISGVKMKSLKMEGSKTEVDLTNIPKGIYLLSIITNGETISKKIIIE